MQRQRAVCAHTGVAGLVAPLARVEIGRKTNVVLCDCETNPLVFLLLPKKTLAEGRATQRSHTHHALIAFPISVVLLRPARPLALPVVAAARSLLLSLLLPLRVPLPLPLAVAVAVALSAARAVARPRWRRPRRGPTRSPEAAPALRRPTPARLQPHAQRARRARARDRGPVRRRRQGQRESGHGRAARHPERVVRHYGRDARRGGCDHAGP